MSEGFGYEPWIIIGNAISLAAISAVLITHFLFQKHLKKKMMVKIIFFMTAAQFGSNMAAVVGYPDRDATLCKLQAFFLPLFTKSTWMWSTMLIIQTHGLVFNSEVKFSFMRLHMMCWGVPLITNIMPLPFVPIGIQQNLSKQNYCFLDAPNMMTYDLWGFFTCVDIGLICALLSLLLLYQMIRRLQSGADTPSTTLLINTVRRLKWYPIVGVSLYAPYFVTTVIQQTLVRHNGEFDQRSMGATVAVKISQIIVTQVGTCMTVIFFFRCHEARILWRRYFRLPPERPSEPDLQEANFEMAKRYDISAEHEASKGSLADSSTLGGSLGDSKMLEMLEVSGRLRSSLLSGRSSDTSAHDSESGRG